MQIEIEDPELMMFIAALIVNMHDGGVGYKLTGQEILDLHFPDHEEVMTPALHEKRYNIYCKLVAELNRTGKAIGQPWNTAPKTFKEYELTYDKDGMNFGCERIDIKTMKLMIEGCEHAN